MTIATGNLATIDLDGALDLTKYKWQEFDYEDDHGYLVHHDQTILDYDRERGTLDLLVRWGKDGGHCMVHRHIASTTCIVLEGEQHFYDYDENGKWATEPRIRRAGEHGLSKGPDTMPHMERGGPDGGVAFFSMYGGGPDAVLYDAYDKDMNVVVEVTPDMILQDFEANAK